MVVLMVVVDDGGSYGDDVEGADGNVGSVNIAYQSQASQRNYSQGLSIHRWWCHHYGGGTDAGVVVVWTMLMVLMVM